MDDFEKAILLSFDQSGDVGAGIKAQAEAYLAAARASPDAWRICLDRFQSSGYAGGGAVPVCAWLAVAVMVAHWNVRKQGCAATRLGSTCQLHVGMHVVASPPA